jgi:class 3 adenylate cyclase/tetratricopeptide (TPR) repeat protein
MRCPRCSAVSLSSAKYCSECGTRLFTPCERCGCRVPADTASCPDCGTAVCDIARTHASRSRTSLAVALAPSGERRQLTIMFCDLVGSTELASQLDPEDLRDVIGLYHDFATELLAQFGGVVGQYLGDGFLAHFGYPQAREDDAERAIHAGLTLIGRVGQLPTAKPLRVRIGVATGLVVVGELFEASSGERAVVGETANLAARLQDVAGPGELVIAAATRRLAGNLFDYVSLGPLCLKGFSATVDVWRVLGESAIASRYEALRSSCAGIADAIGRDEEIGILVRRWQQAKGGEGEVVLVSGEPGIGKSHLLATVQKRVGSDMRNLVRCDCSPQHQLSVLRPFLALVDAAAGVEPDDPPKLRAEKARSLLGELPTEQAEALGELLSLPFAPDPRAQRSSPARVRTLTSHSLLTCLAGLLERGPLLMLVEDAHWLDPTSSELLGVIVERAATLRLLLVVTGRPEYTPPWAGRAHVTTIVLRRLRSNETASLVASVARDAVLSPASVKEIVERSDGIPLYAEELAKSVSADGAARGGAKTAGTAPSAVPLTLHAPLLARLDRLGAVAKEVAQIGAVMGRRFPYRLLARVAPVTGDALDDALEQIVGSGLMSMEGSLPAATLSFKHALLQEAAYGTLLRARRQLWHARIAAALEDVVPQDQECAKPEVLASHFSEAGDPARAVPYWIDAGEKALARAAHREAATFFQRAMDALNSQARTPDTLARQVHLHRRLHNALYPLGELQAARSNLHQAEQVAERLGDAVQLSRVLSSQIYILGATGELNAAVVAGERALALLADRDDLDAAVNTRLMLARTLYAGGRYRAAIARIEEVVALLREDPAVGAMGGLNQTVSAHVWLTLCHAELGHFEEAAQSSAAAMRLAAAPPSSEHEMLWARVGCGRLQVVLGDWTAATEVLEPALPLCQDELAVYFSRIASSLGTAYAGLGRTRDGVVLLEQADRQAQKIGFTFGYALVLVQLGQAYRLLDDSERAHEAGHRALDAARRWGERNNEALAACLLAELAIQGIRRDEARTYVKTAATIAEELRLPLVRARLDTLRRQLGGCVAVD